MPSSNTKNGKGFEYACLKAFELELSNSGTGTVLDPSSALDTAESKFHELTPEEQNKYMRAAKTAFTIISPLEPRLVNGNDPVCISINTDAAAMGTNGDVRDVLFIRSNQVTNAWEIGLSCKHNHEALKHPRITGDKDFGKSWIGIPCRQEFIDKVGAVVDKLIEYGRKKIKWKDIAPDIETKTNSYYYPIVKAYKDEIKFLCQNPKVPSLLLSYFFGSKDFYKVIMDEQHSTTTVEAFNMSGTLGQKVGSHKPIISVPQIKMPTKLLDADFKKDSKTNAVIKTTLILTFDGGWTVSMRLHNKDSIARPTSLAWDVQLVGLPNATYKDMRPWIG